MTVKVARRSMILLMTYKDEHTCPMVYLNKRLTSSYLTSKYLSVWKADPNMFVSGFIDKVKRDNLGDVSKWKVYRTKKKDNEDRKVVWFTIIKLCEIVVPI